MVTNRQNSFVATIGSGGNNLLHFLYHMHAKPAIITATQFSGGHYTGERQSRDDSHLLGTHRDVPLDTWPRLKLYFRFTGSDYRLYIRSEGAYFGKCLNMSDEGFLGAFESEDPTTFNLINQHGTPVTLDTIKEDKTYVYLQPSGSGILTAIRRENPDYVYVADMHGPLWLFNMNIEERGAAYLNSPDEV